jgi:hypothetical protein
MKGYSWVLSALFLILIIYLFYEVRQTKQEVEKVKLEATVSNELLDLYTEVIESDLSLEQTLTRINSIQSLGNNPELLTKQQSNFRLLFEKAITKLGQDDQLDELDKGLSDHQISKDLAKRVESIKELYAKLLVENLALTDSIQKWKEIGRIKDMKADSIKYTGINKMDSLQKVITELKAANNRNLMKFQSPGGVQINYLGDINKQGLANGFGVGVYANGNIYEGKWMNGKKHGEGIYSFSDGELYEGMFSEDKRNGFGQYKWKNGDLYKGYWKDDLRNGKGKIMDSSGKIKQSGVWSKDKLIKEETVEF